MGRRRLAARSLWTLLLALSNCGGRTDAADTGFAGPIDRGEPGAGAGASGNGAPGAGGTPSFAGGPGAGGQSSLAGNAGASNASASAGHASGGSAGDPPNACQACFDTSCADLIAECDATAQCHEGLACVASRCENGSFQCTLACFKANPSANSVAFEMIACIIASCPAGCAGF